MHTMAMLTLLSRSQGTNNRSLSSDVVSVDGSDDVVQMLPFKWSYLGLVR